MNEEIKTIDKVMKQDEYNINLNSIHNLSIKKSIQKFYTKETGYHEYFIKDYNNSLILDDNDNPTIDKNYLAWLIEYREILMNKTKKVRCSNCNNLIQYIHKDRPIVCPSCQHPYWDKPEYEFKLFNLQDIYLKNRDNNSLAEMYKLLKLYAKKTIIKMVKNTYYFKRDDLEMKAHDSANKMIEYYITNPLFIIKDSFGGYLPWPIRQVLWGPKKEDAHDSLNSIIDSENELGDYVLIANEPYNKLTVEIDDTIYDKVSNVSNILCEKIDKIIGIIHKNYGDKEAILVAIGIKNKIKGSSTSNLDSYYLYSGVNIKRHVDNAMLVIYKTLKGLDN